MDEKKRVFEEYYALKALTIMAVPAIISQLITLIYNIADICTILFSYGVYFMVTKKELRTPK